jgi:lysozyme family protein
MLHSLQNGRKKPDNFIFTTAISGFEQVLAQSANSKPLEFSPLAPHGVHPGAQGQGQSDDVVKFRKCLDFVLQKEGSKLVKEDGERGASRYGILQSTARAFGYKGNIKHITQGDVEAIYRKIWDRSGAASLPYPLCVVHFDTYVNSPAAAQKILQKSQGNIDNYLGMREKRYVRLAAAKPAVYAKYLKGWKNRIDSLRTVVAQFEKDKMYARKEISSAKNG